MADLVHAVSGSLKHNLYWADWERCICYHANVQNRHNLALTLDILAVQTQNRSLVLFILDTGGTGQIQFIKKQHELLSVAYKCSAFVNNLRALYSTATRTLDKHAFDLNKIPEGLTHVTFPPCYNLCQGKVLQLMHPVRLIEICHIRI